MRKAVQAATRRNQRRKENAPNEAAVVVIKEAPSSANGHAAAEAKRNKTSPEEAALTAKNYRLAKELVSDGPNPCTARRGVQHPQTHLVTFIASSVGIARKAPRRV